MLRDPGEQSDRHDARGSRSNGDFVQRPTFPTGNGFCALTCIRLEPFQACLRHRTVTRDRSFPTNFVSSVPTVRMSFLVSSSRVRHAE